MSHSAFFMPITDEDWKAMVAKLDGLTADVAALKPKEDTKPPANPLQSSIDKGTLFMRTYLKDSLPKEKLDSLDFDGLLLAADLKSVIKPSVTLNPAPPIEKTDAKKDPRPDWMIPEVEAT